MPMLREDDPDPEPQGNPPSPQPDAAPIPIQTPLGTGKRRLGRRASEESIRTELCDGPLPGSPPNVATHQHPVACAVTDRSELIERLKRGESPTWIPNRHLESLLHQHHASSPPGTPEPAGPASPSLLPAPTITPERPDPTQGQPPVDAALQAGLDIERPRSALHSGNFTPVEVSPGSGRAEAALRMDGGSQLHGGTRAWMGTSPPRDFVPFGFAFGDAAGFRREAFGGLQPSSLSSSLSSSFVYKPPTSPLVRSETNDELDLTLPLNGFNIDASSPRSTPNTRRHTLNLAQSPFSSLANHRQYHLRREVAHPYQAHQPRHSLSSTPNLHFSAGTSPQPASQSRSRRPSFSSDVSPLQHASMVGSYEESILRGRMSTTPSRPLQFLAQIGVLGLGKCKPSLRCPAHVTLPFSAVFYSYPSASYGRSETEDGPSPYVGLIDLENGLPNAEDGQRARRKLQSRYQDVKSTREGEQHRAEDHSFADLSEGDGAAKLGKHKRPSRSPKAPPGGAYRIPEKGQLQVIIKNQNKTAVKLFLVPYDLAGMEAGTKTFIRQRSYSAGPIIDAPNTKDLPTVADRPILRYLIHLHICCPSKGRYYLYKSIRVVFANRVPDGKERLRNEVTYPDPRFSPYKPTRVMYPPSLEAAIDSAASPAAGVAAERAFRRRSTGFPLSHGHSVRPQNPRFHNPEPPVSDAWRSPGSSQQGRPPEDPFSTAAMSGIEMTGPPTISPYPQPGPDHLSTHSNDDNIIHSPLDERSFGDHRGSTYEKLNKGDIGYGGNAFIRSPSPQQPPPPALGYASTSATTSSSSTTTTATEGLLSKRLRSLGVQSSGATADSGRSSSAHPYSEADTEPGPASSAPPWT